jgi:hypothetical protein
MRCRGGVIKVAIKDAGIEAEIDTINGHVDHR